MASTRELRLGMHRLGMHLEAEGVIDARPLALRALERADRAPRQ